MLTPSPTFPLRVWMPRRGMGASLPSTGMPSASSGAGIMRWQGRPRIGIRGVRGLGQVSCDANGENCVDLSSLPVTSGQSDTPYQDISLTPSSPQSGGGGGTTTGGVNWTTVATTAITAAQKGVQLSQLTNMPPGTYYSGGGVVASTAGIPTGVSALSTAALGNMLPILLGGGLLLVFMMGRR